MDHIFKGSTVDVNIGKVIAMNDHSSTTPLVLMTCALIGIVLLILTMLPG